MYYCKRSRDPVIPSCSQIVVIYSRPLSLRMNLFIDSLLLVPLLQGIVLRLNTATDHRNVLLSLYTAFC